MTYKTILAVITREEDAQAQIADAITFANTFDAHLLGCHPAEVDIAYASAVGFPDAEFLRTATEVNTERTKLMAKLFTERAQDAKRSAHWVGEYGQLTENSTIARCVDLVVTAAPRSGDSAEVEKLLYDAGRPVLVFPRSQTSGAPYKRIVIGWDASKQAARAVFDALPLLKQADAVDVLVIGVDDSQAPTDLTIIDTLKRHGVKAELVCHEDAELSVDEALAHRIAEVRADLLVVGAYGHSWLRQFLFGGTTEQVLRSSSVTTLFAH